MKQLAEMVIIVVLALCLTVSADMVFTRDGQVHQGKISLGTNYTVRVVAPGSTNLVTATNLLRAVFGPDVIAMPWHHIGPFGASGFDEAHDKAFLNETAVDLKKEYGNLKWKEVNFIDGMVHVLSAEGNSATYLYRIIHSASPTTLEASLGSDDSIKLWLNSRLILNNKVLRAAVPGQDRVRLELVKGENMLLIKIANGQVSSSFYFKTQRMKAWSASHAVPNAGIMMWDGSFTPVQVKKVDDERVFYSNADIVRLNVSAVFFRPLSIVEVNKMSNKPAGVFLMNGDFVEGELRSMDQKEVVVSSVLFGLKKYKPFEEAVALVLRPASKTTVRHHFKLRDNSLMFAKKFGVKDSQVTLSAGPFKGRVIPLTQIAEMTYGPVPNLLQSSAIHWESLPGETRQSLETRDRNNLSIVQEYSKWRARLAIAKSVTADELPPLVKAETEAQAEQAKALRFRDAARQQVTAKTQTHAQAKTALTAAGSKLDADCHQIDLKSEEVARLISTGQNPNLKNLAEAQRKFITVSLARVINARNLLEVQAEVTRTTAARQAAQSAAKTSEANLTTLKAILTVAKTALVAAERDLQAKQKAITDAHTALTNVLIASFQPGSRAMASSDRQFIDIRQRQIKADQRVLQLNMAMKRATTDFQAIDKKAKASVTAVTAAKAKTTTVTTGDTTAKTKLTTATNAVKTAKQTLESLQKIQLNPAIAKAEAADKALTLAIQGKLKADQLLADINKMVAQAMKTVVEANKLAQIKFEPEQLKKDLAATQTLVEQLKVLTAAVQVPIDDINTTRRKAALAIGLAAPNSLVTATANKNIAYQALATLRENITKATIVHTAAEKAAVAAETKAKAALTALTTAANALAADIKDFEINKASVEDARKTMGGKFTTLQSASHIAGIARRVVIEANSNKSRAVSVVLAAKTRLAEATASSAAAAAAAKNAAAATSTATTQLKAASGALTKAESNWNKKKNATDKARTALVTMTTKQTAANAKYALANREYFRAQLGHSTALQLLTSANAQVEQAKAELQKLEQKARDAKDKDEAAALKILVKKAKGVLSQLTSKDQKKASSKVKSALTALSKAKAARDAADKALLALNVQVTVATTATRKAIVESDIAFAQLKITEENLDHATVNQQLANARSAEVESEAAAAKQVLAAATVSEKAAKALAIATTAAATKAGTGRITASKALVAATQQATDSALTHRAAVKARDESGAKVKVAKSNVSKAATALADAQKIALQQRGSADKAKKVVDELSLTQQKKAQDGVAAATAATTKAQADMVAANELLKRIEEGLATLVQTVLQVEQAGATVAAIIKTLEADTVSSIKLAAEKNLLMELTRKMVESFVNVNKKRAMDKATAANTALTQAKTNKIEAGKALMMAKLKVADSVTVVQKAEQVMRNAESDFKVAEMNLAKAQGEQAMAEKLAEEKIKQATGAKDSLTQLTAEQKLAVTAASTAKTILTKTTADKAKMRQAFNTANKGIVTLVSAINTAKNNAGESEAKLKAARISTEKVSEEMRILELQAAAWREKAVRAEGDLTRLTALRHTPATVLFNTLNTASTQALTNRGNSEKALAATMQQVATQELARWAAVALGLASGAAELKAQLDEENRWKELVLARQEVEHPEADYRKAVEDYQARKKETDTVRSKVSRAQQEINLSNANLTRLKPAYDALIRP